MQVNFYTEENRLILVIDNPPASIEKILESMIGTATGIEGLKPLEKEEPKKPTLPEKETPHAKEGTVEAKDTSVLEDKKEKKPSSSTKDIPEAVAAAYELSKNSKEMNELGIDKSIAILYPGCRKAANKKLKELTGTDNLNDFLANAEQDLKVTFVRFVQAECAKNRTKYGF